MRALRFLFVIALFSSQAFAQLATPTGHEVNVGVGGYKYVEPGDTSISIHGPKFGGRIHGHDVARPGPALVCPGQCAGHHGHTHIRWLVFAVSDHARQQVAKWLRAGYR